MAVTFKTDTNYGYKLMGLFGVNAQLIVAAKNANVTVDQTYPGSFQVKRNGVSYGSVVIKGAAISLVKSGTLGPTSKEAVAVQFEQTLKSALKGVMDLPASASQSDKAAASAGDLNGILPKGGNVSPNNPLAPQAPKPTSPGLTVNKASSGAFFLKQKIAGTSNGSTYTVVALFAGGLALAVRAKNGILSVRAVFSSGAGGNKGFKDKLLGLGFSAKSAAVSSYLSAHYSCGTPDLMVKTMGCIIGSLGFSNAEGLTDLTEVL